MSFLGVELDRAYLEEAVARVRQTLRAHATEHESLPARPHCSATGKGSE